MFVVIGSVAALVMGTALGWLLRGPARWCPGCGRHLWCVICQPVGAAVARDLPRGQQHREQRP